MSDPNTDVDLPRFKDAAINQLARAVAKCFGGSQELGREGEYYEAFATIHIPEFAPMPAYRLTLRISTAARLTVRLHPVTSNNGVNTSDLQFPEATMSLARGNGAICADISRRVVNHPTALISLTEFYRRYGVLQARDKDLKQHLSELLATCPNVSVAANSPPSGGSVRLYCHGAGCHLDATLYATGDISIDRVGSLPFDRAVHILAILAEG